MAGSVSAEVWLNQRRWDALEESLKTQGSNIERHLQDYLIKLYNETVPFDQWLQIENAITKEELESAQAAEDQKVYAAFHIRENSLLSLSRKRQSWAASKMGSQPSLSGRNCS